MKRVFRNQGHSFLLRILAVVLLGVAAFHASPACASTAAARVVKYSKEDIVPVRAKLRFSTLIVLPDDESHEVESLLLDGAAAVHRNHVVDEIVLGHRTRTDERHVAHDDVQELRQLVKAPPPEKAADFGDAWVVWNLEGAPVP